MNLADGMRQTAHGNSNKTDPCDEEPQKKDLF